MQQYGPYMHDRGSWHPWLALVFFVLVGAVVATGVWLLVRGSHRPAPFPYAGHLAAPPAPPSDPALDTLRLRFARGEIDADEYASRAALLSGGPPPPAASG